MDPSTQRVLTRFKQRLASANPNDLAPTIKQLGIVHNRIQTWLRGFPLQEALKNTASLPKGWIWQEPFVGFFERYDTYQDQLYDLGQKLDVLSLVSDPGVIKKARFVIEPPKGARIDQAINDIEFAPHPDMGQNQIIYPKANIDGWYSKFSDWTSKSSKLLKSLL